MTTKRGAAFDKFVYCFNFFQLYALFAASWWEVDCESDDEGFKRLRRAARLELDWFACTPLLLRLLLLLLHPLPGSQLHMTAVLLWEALLLASVIIGSSYAFAAILPHICLLSRRRVGGAGFPICEYPSCLLLSLSIIRPPQRDFHKHLRVVPPATFYPFYWEVWVYDKNVWTVFLPRKLR